MKNVKTNYRARIFTAVFTAAVGFVFSTTLWFGCKSNPLLNQKWVDVILGCVLLSQLFHVGAVVMAVSREHDATRLLLWGIESTGHPNRMREAIDHALGYLQVKVEAPVEQEQPKPQSLRDKERKRKKVV